MGFLTSNLRELIRQRVFHVGFKAALPCTVLTGVVKFCDQSGAGGHEGFAEGLVNNSAFSSFTFLIGLFVAFRASQAYGRFWTGARSSFGITADFFDVASSLMSFARNSKVDRIHVTRFQHMIVRLFSILHALILADLEVEGHATGKENAFQYELIDIEGVDMDSLEVLKHAGPRRVDLVFHWIQSTIVEAHQSQVLVVPPPILTRAFQEFNNGMIEYHRALALAEIPFPFPYTAATRVVLIIHWLLTPVVAATWSNHIWSSAALSFVQVFVLWALNTIAQELENPFGKDVNDLDMQTHHLEFNSRLLYLLQNANRRCPQLSSRASMDVNILNELRGEKSLSLQAVWDSQRTHEDLRDIETSFQSRCQVPQADLTPPPAVEPESQNDLQKTTVSEGVSSATNYAAINGCVLSISSDVQCRRTSPDIPLCFEASTFVVPYDDDSSAPGVPGRPASTIQVAQAVGAHTDGGHSVATDTIAMYPVTITAQTLEASLAE